MMLAKNGQKDATALADTFCGKWLGCKRLIVAECVESMIGKLICVCGPRFANKGLRP
jgi:hypothetical protein